MLLWFLNIPFAVMLFGTTFAEQVNERYALRPNTSNSATTVLSTGNRKLYSQLIEQLLRNASPMVPPNADNVSEPVNISVTFRLQNILQLDMNDQVLAIFGWFQIRWYDKSLSWDTDLYSVDTVFLQADKIWRPDVVLYNSIEPLDQLTKLEMQIKVDSDGLVTWNIGTLFQYRCFLDMRLFPFDTQRCELYFGLWTQVEKHVNCTRYNAISIRFPNPEWEVLGVHATRIDRARVDTEWYITYTVVLKRKWMFYLLNVLLPVLLVTALNSVVLVLPVDCGEKMSVSVTAFLTLAVFTTLIQDNLPNNSDTVCYLAVYLATQMILSVVVVILSAVILKCHHSNRHVSSVAYHDQTKEGENDMIPDGTQNASESLVFTFLHNFHCYVKETDTHR